MNASESWFTRTREPPTAKLAEAALLGAILSNNKAYEAVCDFLVPEHFAFPVNAMLFREISERILDGQKVDAITLNSALMNNTMLQEVGGTEYLTTLLASMVSINVSADYGRTIYETWMRRCLIETANEIVNMSFGNSEAIDGRKIIDHAVQELSALAEGRGGGSRTVSIGQAVGEALTAALAARESGRPAGVMSGIATVDKALGGFLPGTFTLLAGIQGAGKTALATQMAVSIARQSLAMDAGPRAPGVALFSLEMSAKELGERVLSHAAEISGAALINGRFGDATADRLIAASRNFGTLPLRVIDAERMSLKLLAAKIRLHLQRQPERLVIVDHMLILGGDGSGRTGGADLATVVNASQALKALAKNTGIPLLVLTHSTRASAQRQDPRPMIYDLKWAGEGDADNVVFVYRPIQFFPDEKPKRKPREADERYRERVDMWENERREVEQIVEIVVRKRRHGETGIYKMRWTGGTTSFQEWDAPAASSGPPDDDPRFREEIPPGLF